MRAKVNGQYLTKALTLDRECFSSESDVEARPILRKLRSCPKSGGRAWAPSRDAARKGMLLVGARRGGKAHPPEAQIVPQSPEALRGRLRRMQLGHPSAAAGGGKVRGHAPLAPSWSRIR